MIQPNEIKQKAKNKYSDYLRSLLNKESFFPLNIVGNKKPNKDSAEFEKELTELINHSKEKKGYGYTVEYKTIKTKQYGEQDIPQSISFQNEDDYLKFINKEKETMQFKKDIAHILSLFPELKDLISQYPSKIIDKSWEDLIKVCQYFQQNPKPNLYIRELPIKVHTKFIEQNKGIIKELLDIIIAKHINENEKEFERRYHLKYDEPVVRFRILDKDISQKYFSGCLDLSLPVSQFQLLNLPIDTVFIVENKMNMLTFPNKEKSMVIFGKGFSVNITSNTKWLKNKKIYYWGDLDAQGFQILSEIRTHFPQVKSFLMDKKTFNDYFENDKRTETKVAKNLCLTQEEQDMFQFLKENNFRLEQEKIPLAYVCQNLIQLFQAA